MSQIFDEHNQMIIRFPEEIAQQLNQYFLNGGEQPEVTLQADYQQKQTNPRVSLKVGVNGENYKATVVQLPTVSSTFKTIDRVNFFKSNDISEMIVVHENEYDIINESQAETILQRNGEKAQKYLAESGLSDATHNIRQNNYRQRPDVPPMKVQVVDKCLEGIKQEFTNQGKQDEKQQKNMKKKKTFID